MAVSALVGAIGEGNTPLGRSLEAVVKASSLASALQTASTVPELAAVAASVLELLPLDDQTSATLSALTTVGSLSMQFTTALTSRPVDLAAGIGVVTELAGIFGAPAWLISGLHLLTQFGPKAELLAEAISQGETRACFTHALEIVAILLDLDPAMARALGSLASGNALEATQGLSSVVTNFTFLTSGSSVLPFSGLATISFQTYTDFMTAISSGGALATRPFHIYTCTCTCTCDNLKLNLFPPSLQICLVQCSWQLVPWKRQNGP